MSRRARAIGFACAALLCAILAAALASGYSGRVAGQFGSLRARRHQMPRGFGAWSQATTTHCRGPCAS